MKEKIKEILDKLNNKAEHYILYDYEVKLLLDYITNLQEENERLKEELLQEKKDFKEANDYCFELKDYKQRNEKAIEYITEDDLFYYGDELYDSYQEIINILKGDKDE